MCEESPERLPGDFHAKEGECVMDGAVIKTDDTGVDFGQWHFSDIVEFEHKKQALREERRELDRERRRLERERRQLNVEINSEKLRMERESRLFDMKFKILEEELKKLADEKLEVEKQRKFYKCVNDYENSAQRVQAVNVVRGELFFVGVENEQSLKKRYKDLLKIYHPDNLNGDNATLQEINREYGKLKAQYSAMMRTQ